MSTYMLVHGAWHGGWCWQRLAPLLAAAGHVVYTPTLSGLGERVHLASPGTTLSTHITDIVNACAYEDLHEIVLVGHSYAGMVITGAAGLIRERIAHLVYVDAFVPNSEQSAHDLVGADGAALQCRLAEEQGGGWLVPPQVDGFGLDKPEDLAWVVPRLCPQPLRTLSDRVIYDTALEAAPFSLTYIRATLAPSAAFSAAASRAQREPGWSYDELPSGHDAMVTHPAELTEILLRASRDRS